MVSPVLVKPQSPEHLRWHYPGTTSGAPACLVKRSLRFVRLANSTFSGASAGRCCDIFDDGSLSEQPFKKVKAFTDVGNVESMSKERWGAKWVKGQPRIYCVNDFDSKKEPEDCRQACRTDLLCQPRQIHEDAGCRQVCERS